MAEKESILEEVKEKFRADKDAWQESYDKAIADHHFMSDDQFAQWDKQDYEARVSTRRPALTIDQLGQFVHQVVNDIRLNTPTINVIPSGIDSDQETADVIKGLIKNIEYVSNADNAYDTAAYNAVLGGIGFIRVDHDYVGNESFDQELLIKRVTNPFAVYFDSASTEIDGRDACHATILDKMRVDEFKKKYPDFTPSSFDDDSDNSDYNDDDFVTIAEHYYFDEEEYTIGIDESGNVFKVDGSPVNAVRTRKVKSRIVRRCKLSGKDVLEETVFPGKYIPIVPVYGEEHWIDGKRNLLSLIRKSKDAQRMFNYWKSLETELLMKAPQAPVTAPEGSTEEYAKDWLNPSKSMVLRYKTFDTNGRPLPPPQRMEPPTIPVGIVNAARQTVDDIKATMGIYNAALGMKSNETSGVAINQRKMEGDVATYHFSDNLMKSICQVGRIIVGAIKDVYDVARILRIIGVDDESKQIGVNGQFVEGQENDIDLTKGQYDVKVITGASFTTMRQEATAALQNLFQQQPELMQVMGDLYFKNSDFAGAHEMAERMKKVIDPKFRDEEDVQDDMPQSDPEKEQMAQIIKQGAQEIQNLQLQLEQLKSDNSIKQIEAQVKLRELALKEQQMSIEAAQQAKELDLKEAELAIKAQEIQSKENIETAKLQVQVLSNQSNQQPQMPVYDELGNQV